MTVPDVERWLVQILEAWRDANGPEMVEPWDYRYVQGEANRQLAPVFAKVDMLALDHRFYRDLGADLDQLGVHRLPEARALCGWPVAADCRARRRAL